MQEFLHKFAQVAVPTLHYYAALILPMLIYCVALYFIAKVVRDSLMKLFGWKGTVFFAVVGTPVHELSHAAAAIIGGQKVVKMNLISPDEKTGTLGSVQISYDKKSFYQRNVGVILVAFSPIFAGAAAIVLLTWLAFPLLLRAGAPPVIPTELKLSLFAAWIKQNGAWIGSFFSTAVKSAPYHKWWFYLYLFGLLSVGAHLIPSPQDMKGTARPILILLLIAFVVYAVAGVLFKVKAPFEAVMSYSYKLNGILSFAIVLNLVFMILVLILLKIKEALFSDAELREKNKA